MALPKEVVSDNLSFSKTESNCLLLFEVFAMIFLSTKFVNEWF